MATVEKKKYVYTKKASQHHLLTKHECEHNVSRVRRRRTIVADGLGASNGLCYHAFAINIINVFSSNIFYFIVILLSIIIILI